MHDTQTRQATKNTATDQESNDRSPACQNDQQNSTKANPTAAYWDKVPKHPKYDSRAGS